MNGMNYLRSIGFLTSIVTLSYPAFSAQDVGACVKSGGEYPAIPAVNKQISDVCELRWLSENSSAWTSDWIQTADIDLSNSKQWNSGKGFSPIGNGSSQFKGGYNGQGYEISGLYINRPTSDHIGLFGFINHAANPSNYKIQNITLSGDGDKSNIDIKGANRVGGVIGSGHYVLAENLESSMVIVADRAVGGLIGYFHGSDISQSRSFGSITSLESSDVFMGTSASAGGFIGEASYGSAIENSFSQTDVNGTKRVGGFVGEADPFISIVNSYSVGTVSGTSSVSSFIGTQAGTATNAVYDCDFGISGTSDCGEAETDGSVGFSSSVMKAEQTYLALNWDITSDAWQESIWKISEGSYPTHSKPISLIVSPKREDMPTEIIIEQGSLSTIALAAQPHNDGASVTFELRLEGDVINPHSRSLVPSWVYLEPTGEYSADLIVDAPILTNDEVISGLVVDIVEVYGGKRMVNSLPAFDVTAYASAADSSSDNSADDAGSNLNPDDGSNSGGTLSAWLLLLIIPISVRRVMIE
ncbi:hypothetical protein F0231_06955 [Vibrio sp. RE86]|uniref:hypothetical protein n=1 Tax=Vibrio sp. RE86 TaxID=2607605 RepID=UPI001493B2A3|nr:hypothetical protein [Vibrio sp. RE86]NOH79479.1 hypothetical protein [Vibrio sp. RE86]